MTTGKMIKFCRERSGMSVNTLAKKLSVNEDTLCKWENDTELPPINSLWLLCDIFGLPFVEIAQTDLESDAGNEQASERYTINFTLDEIEHFNRMQLIQVLKKMSFFVILIGFMSFKGLIDDPYLITKTSVMLSVLAFMILIAVFYGLLIAGHIKESKKINKSAVLNTIEYEFHDNYFIFRKYKFNELIIEAKYYYYNIKKITVNDKWIEIYLDGIIHSLRRNEIRGNSHLYMYMDNHKAKVTNRIKNK